ncbi:MAG: histidine kinase [Gemmatimonadaceae bacterium]|nr:histidine kinase [Gemmatimonadaceae bacterium]
MNTRSTAPLSAEAPLRRLRLGPIRASLLVAWVPMWILCAGLLAAVHGLPAGIAAVVALRFVVPAALMGLGVQTLVARRPWPPRITWRFVVLHVSGALAYGVALTVLMLAQELLVRGQPMFALSWRMLGVVVLGVWLYVMIASFSYTVEEGRRAARAEAAAARTQLDALRGQLQPHFLFNALHTMVHMIPVDPATAARAAEELAGLLRSAISETRDLISLREERAFVERYLALEQLRFEERLVVESRWSTEADDMLVPSFAVQTLVENAVRHGAAQRMGPTQLLLESVVAGDGIRIVVVDSGHDIGRTFARSDGTGLDRLEERLALLFGPAATFSVEQTGDDRVEARLFVPSLDDAP